MSWTTICRHCPSLGDRRPPEHLQSVGGGCINQTWACHWKDGDSCFVKILSEAPKDFFTAEAAGLQTLAATDSVRVPAVLAVHPTALVLEHIATSCPGRDYGTQLGQQLAAMHAHHGPHFGFDQVTYCGATRQDNTPTSDGWRFFAERRLGDLARRCRDQGLLDRDETRAVEAVGEGLPDLAPDQPPVVIHGDLWGGNAIADTQGLPVLIDPAVHWGWAEAELAMTCLFGGFPTDFYNAYAEASDLAPDWRDRVDLYNAYHLLNHLLLFGGGYHRQAMAAIRRYL